MAPASLRLEGVSHQAGAVSGLVGLLRAAMRAHNVFRGQIISLHQSGHGEQVRVQFHAVPTVARHNVILSPGTLERLERHTIGIAENAERLRATLTRRLLGQPADGAAPDAAPFPAMAHALSAAGLTASRQGRDGRPDTPPGASRQIRRPQADGSTRPRAAGGYGLVGRV